MYLIGDIGGTSADWVLISQERTAFYDTIGYNPASQSDARLKRLCNELKIQVDPQPNVKIHYFGAGTNFPGAPERIQDQLGRVLDTSFVEVQSDLVGAAKALCGDEGGVIAILGTGSNICHFDGTKISRKGVSLGFLLGDEGSGSDLGVRLMRQYYYGQFPAEMERDAAAVFPKTSADFLREYKASDAPNQLLASYVKLMSNHRDHPFVHDLVKTAFRSFCESHLPAFETYRKINFVGSIAFYFCTELEEVLREFDFELGKVIRRPIEALASYFKSKNF